MAGAKLADYDCSDWFVGQKTANVADKDRVEQVVGQKGASLADNQVLNLESEERAVQKVEPEDGFRTALSAPPEPTRQVQSE